MAKKTRIAFLLIALLLCGILSGCGLMRRNFFGKSSARSHSKATKGLTMEMRLSPLPLRLSQTRALNVCITVKNRSKRFIQLPFPTSERLEILLANETGKTLLRWSDDQPASPFPCYVGINPGEQIEYEETLSTRDLAAGRPYTVTALFPHYPHLTIQKTIKPE